MSHTFRIYNNPNLKKTKRYYWDNSEIIDERFPYFPINNKIRGFPYTKYKQICMGRCPSCRDPKKEPKNIRKKLKESLRFQLKEEL